MNSKKSGKGKKSVPVVIKDKRKLITIIALELPIVLLICIIGGIQIHLKYNPKAILEYKNISECTDLVQYDVAKNLGLMNNETMVTLLQQSITAAQHNNGGHIQWHGGNVKMDVEPCEGGFTVYIKRPMLGMIYYTFDTTQDNIISWDRERSSYSFPGATDDVKFMMMTYDAELLLFTMSYGVFWNYTSPVADGLRTTDTNLLALTSHHVITSIPFIYNCPYEKWNSGMYLNYGTLPYTLSDKKDMMETCGMYRSADMQTESADKTYDVYHYPAVKAGPDNAVAFTGDATLVACGDYQAIYKMEAKENTTESTFWCVVEDTSAEQQTQNRWGNQYIHYAAKPMQLNKSYRMYWIQSDTTAELPDTVSYDVPKSVVSLMKTLYPANITIG